MINMQLWDKKEGFNYANGKAATIEEIYNDFPFTKTSGHVVLEYLPNGNVGGIDDLEILKDVFGVTATDPQEALEQIIYARENPPLPDESQAPATKEEIQHLGQQLTDLELLIYEKEI